MYILLHACSATVRLVHSWAGEAFASHLVQSLTLCRRCCALVPGVVACVHMYMLWGRWKLHQTGVFYDTADKYMHRDRCCWHYSTYLWQYSPQGVHMHSCTCCLFICTVQSIYYMRVYHRCFLTPACVGGRGLEVGSFPACPWLALVAGVGGYVLAGVEIGVLSCMCLYFCWC